MRKPIVACVAVGIVLSACGGPSAEDEVRATVVRFGRAVRAHDYGRICDNLLSSALLAKLDQAGVPCRVALEQGLGSVRDPTLEVLLVTVRNPNLALVRVRTGAAGQRSSIDTLRVVREPAGWRIASLSVAPAKPAPKPQPKPAKPRPAKPKPAPRRPAPAKKTTPAIPPAGPPAPTTTTRR